MEDSSRLVLPDLFHIGAADSKASSQRDDSSSSQRDWYWYWYKKWSMVIALCLFWLGIVLGSVFGIGYYGYNWVDSSASSFDIAGAAISLVFFAAVIILVVVGWARRENGYDVMDAKGVGIGIGSMTCCSAFCYAIPAFFFLAIVFIFNIAKYSN